MDSFQDDYLVLLKRQVNEEIQYLIANGHDNSVIHERCMFCTIHPHGHFVCYRMAELRRFQSSIVQHEASRSRVMRNIPKQRRVVGFDAVNSNEPMNYNVQFRDNPSDMDNLPIMYPNL